MALVVYDRVQQTGNANTTVSFTLSGSVTGFQSFAVVGNGNTTYYAATDASGNYEVGIGTYSTTGPTLTRTTILASSNSNLAATFVGVCNIFVTYPAGKSVNLDASGNVTPLGTVASGTWNGTTIGVAYGGTGVTASSGANSVMLRDANQNVAINRLNQANTNTSAAGGTTALTAASSYSQTLTGTGNQTYTMPDATTLTTGVAFVFNNNATGTLTLQDYATGAIGTITSGGAVELICVSTATVAGTWDYHGFLPENVTWGTNALALGGTVITGGTWQGGTIQSAYGGTGLTTFTAANNALYSTSASTLVAGTLPVAAGGTAKTSFTANQVLYGSLSQSSDFTFSSGNLLVLNSIGINGATGYSVLQQAQANAALPSYTFYGDAGTGMFRASANTLAFSTNASEKMRIDSSGNLGLGVTPNAWGVVGPAMQFGGGSINGGSGSFMQVISNAYYDGSNYRYVNTEYASRYIQNTGAHTWNIAPSGTAGGVVTFTEAMRITNAGLVGIGTASPAKLLDVNGDALINGLTVGRGGGAVSTNTALGSSALTANTTGAENTAVGYRTQYVSSGNQSASLGTYALYNNTASNNTAIGYSAMGNSAITGANNTGVGSSILNSLTSGTNNSATGYQALLSNTTGTNNTGIGSGALRQNTTASNNTAVGYQAAYNNTTGIVTAIGRQALYLNTTGVQNVAVGSALEGVSYPTLGNNTTGSYNTAVGDAALQANTTASNNTAVGYRAGYNNTTGGENTTIGTFALYSNTTAANNVAVGYQAGYSGVTATQNVFVGFQAGYSDTAGFTTCVGYQAGSGKTTGDSSTLIGRFAGQAAGSHQSQTFVGDSAGQQTTGASNTFIGTASGYLVTTGANNTIIGGYTGNSGGLDIRTASNYIVLSDGPGNPRGIFDGSGNLGLGVAPSAWGVGKAVQIGAAGDASLWGFLNSAYLSSNAYYNGVWIYTATAAATQYLQQSGQHIWYNAPSGTAASGITFTPRMTLDASGNLGIGTTTPSYNLQVYNNADVWHFVAGGATGQVRIGGQPAGGGVIGAYAPDNTPRNLLLQRDGANVGIGTTTPSTALQVNGTVTATTFSGSGSGLTGVPTAVKMWVYFQGGNGNTAGVILGSFNVSSVTVNGTGDYTINFTTATANANYAVNGTVQFDSGGSTSSAGGFNIARTTGTQTTTTCRICTFSTYLTSYQDFQYVSASVLGA